MNELLLGDSLDILKTLDANTIDAMVTDPPAGIGFMGKTWDSHKGGRKEWIAWLSEVMGEALRVMKPGAYGLVWALPRTSHWTGMALEDAGFEIRDCIYHVFGSGFPKSLNVGKAIDKLQGNERAVAPPKQFADGTTQRATARAGIYSEEKGQAENTVGTGVWEGYGTALKPAVECWWLVRKPLAESTVAKNVLEYGTGALNIDASRIDGVPPSVPQPIFDSPTGNVYGFQTGEGRNGDMSAATGRWPSHLIHDGSDEVLEHFPQVAGKKPFKKLTGYNFDVAGENKDQKYESQAGLGEIGSAARFFYCAKPSKAERNAGLEGFEEKEGGCLVGNNVETQNPGNKIGANPTKKCSPVSNNHPTVKGQALMKYLIRLITPPDGVVLDPFMGSGSTGVACKTLGYDFVGIELDPEYLEIASARIDHAEKESVVEQLDLLAVDGIEKEEK